MKPKLGTTKCGRRSMRAVPRRTAVAGVTLVELVVVIVIIGVLATAGAMLLGRVAASALVGSTRFGMAASVDAGLRRIAAELQGALPNSVRVTTAGGVVFIEYVPVLDAGRYRREPDAAGGGNPLDIDDPTDAAFDVLGATVSAAAGAQLVINNLGSGDADAYAGGNRRGGVVLPGGGSAVAFTPAGPFSAGGSAHHRFHLVGAPVTVACAPGADGTGQLWRVAGYGWQAIQPTSLVSGPLPTASRALLLDGVSACDAAYSASHANLGVVTLSLTVQADGESARLLHQVAVDNTP